MLLLGVILITITNKDGQKTQITVPAGTKTNLNVGPGSTVEIATDDTHAAPLLPPSVSQPPGFALEFDGQSSYVEIPTLTFQELLRANPRQPVTLEAVVSSHSGLSEPAGTLVSRNPLLLKHARLSHENMYHGFSAVNIHNDQGILVRPCLQMD